MSEMSKFEHARANVKDQSGAFYFCIFLPYLQSELKLNKASKSVILKGIFSFVKLPYCPF